MEQTIEEGKDVADETRDKASAGSIALFVGLLIGLTVASLGGRLSSKKATGTDIAKR